MLAAVTDILTGLVIVSGCVLVAILGLCAAYSLIKIGVKH